MAQWREIPILNGTTDALHGTLLLASATGFTVADMLTVLASTPEIQTMQDFDAAVCGAIELRRIAGRSSR